MNGLTLRLRDMFASEDAPVNPAPQGKFVKGINFGGKALTIEGYPWEAYSTALGNGLSVPDASTVTTEIVPLPYASPNLRHVLNTVIYKPQTLDIRQVLPNGNYEVYVWIMENFQSDWHSMDLSIVGNPIATNVGKLPFRQWARYGAYPVAITTGSLNLSITTNDPNIDAHLMGLSIFRLNA